MADGRYRQTPPRQPGIRPRPRRDALGTYWVFEVRWTDPGTKRKMSETRATPDDAEDFKAHLRLLKRRGSLGDLDRGRETLDAFATEWLVEHASTALDRRTLRAYAGTYNLHVSPRIGGLQLRQLTPKVIDQLKQALLSEGVGKPTVLKALAVLSSMLSQAVVWDRTDANAVRSVRKPAATRSKLIVPLSIEEVEALIALVRERSDYDSPWMLVELMAYTGARPQDALAVPFTSIGERRIVYADQNVEGAIIKGSKTGSDKSRSVSLFRTVERDLQRYRLAQPPTTSGLVIVRRDGEAWKEHDYKNWCSKRPKGRKRKDGSRSGSLGPFTEAARAIGRSDITPYYLRHTYASLRIAEQRLSLKEIADEMGHSLKVLSDTYVHVISEYRGQGPIDPDALIAAARSGKSSTSQEERDAQ